MHVRNIAISVSVCLFICPLAYLKRATPSNFTNFFLHITCNRGGSALLWRQYVIYFRFCWWRHVSHNGASRPCMFC